MSVLALSLLIEYRHAIDASTKPKENTLAVFERASRLTHHPKSSLILTRSAWSSLAEFQS
jgi:hypothetical protein